MMPVLSPIRPATAHTPPDLRLAAIIVRDAAEALAEEAREASDVARYLLAADRISTGLDSPRTGREQILLTSPALTERSGRNRTLIEMIEAEPSDDDYRLRLAKLLFRALLWRPETFPPPDARIAPLDPDQADRPMRPLEPPGALSSARDGPSWQA